MLILIFVVFIDILLLIKIIMEEVKYKNLEDVILIFFLILIIIILLPLGLGVSQMLFRNSNC